MRIWLAILLLLALAAAAAFGWHWLAVDPGYVLVRLRGVSIETSVVFALICLLVLWGLLSLLLRLLRWPGGAWRRAAHRRGRDRMASGLTAFAEGRYAQAEADLAKAAQHAPVRAPALLAQAHAAHARGAGSRANELLTAAGADAAPAALASHARFLIDDGEAGQALALLKPAAARVTLAPLGWRLLIEAALICGDNDTAIDALAPLARTHLLTAERQAVLETRVFAAALAGAGDAGRLGRLWSALGRAQRRRPRLVEAYARRAAVLGDLRGAMDAIESAQRREYDDGLARCYAELGPAELPERMRTAEAWLDRTPNSAVLLTALGRMGRDQSLWITAERYLERALAISESAEAWEALGDCHRGQGDAAIASTCYVNALRVHRGEPTEPVDPQGAKDPVDTRALVFEERNAHGVPKLPD
ncbi:MAG TPA: heme biosynthesis HemY N-terminal domain-containing protein [Rhodanobacteraceae bacterium]|nr:heme biosynthesis HemY N-terminal domain-containing protein [Rhodanobacteraceae bacterium]